MEQLSRIAQGIAIGNGEVWNFLDYAVNIECSNLLTYTQDKRFLRNNLFSNMGHGGRRYKGDDIPQTNVYHFNKHDYTILSSNGGDIKGEFNIGDLYTVPEINGNTTKGFIYDNKFTELNNYIRLKNSSRRHKIITEYNIKPESYLSVFFENEGDAYLPNDEFGDAYKVKVNDFRRIYSSEIRNIEGNIRDKLERENFLTSSFNRDIKYNEQTSITHSSVQPQGERKNLRKVANIIRYLPLEEGGQYDWRIFQNTYIKKNGIKDCYWPTSKNDLFEMATFNGFEASIPKDKIDHTYNGLSEYSKQYRLEYDSNLSGRDFFWNPKNTYGVNLKVGREFYNIDKKNNYNGDVSIDSKFNGGGHVLYNPSQDSITYSYFQEAEGGSIPNMQSKGLVSDGTSVSLSDYSGVSNLLSKTNELFKKSKISTLINRFHTTGDENIKSDVITAFNYNFGLSRGRNLLKKEYEGKQIGDKSTGYDNPYCRVWTAHRQYSKLKDRMRPFITDGDTVKTIADMQSDLGGLRPRNGAINLSSKSVLSTDGFVRITPTHSNGTYSNIKNYMFSIENLAWKDGYKSLSVEQRGDYGGRIMWFPPYNLKFSENVAVNWNSNTFIGRGEDIHTYTNTVRTGTLDFTILIDHPSLLNKWRGTSLDVANKEEKDKDILRFFVGYDGLKIDNDTSKKSSSTTSYKPTITPDPTFQSRKIAYVVFFPHNFSGSDFFIDKSEENLEILVDGLLKYNKGESITASDKIYSDETLKSDGFDGSANEDVVRKHIFNNDESIEINYLNDLIKIDKNFTGNKIYGLESSTCVIDSYEVKGFSSTQEKSKEDGELCLRRAKTINKILKEYSTVFNENDIKRNDAKGVIKTVNSLDGVVDVNKFSSKLARCAYIIVNVKWKGDNVPSDITPNFSFDDGLFSDLDDNSNSNIPMHSEVSFDGDNYTYDNEYLYFSELKSDSLIHKKIVDKVRYFDPAFHSITPEGFNSRLTFLHQCTRQGPTHSVNDGNDSSKNNDYLRYAGNLSFGTAPYCILRIGDFFNTKICIDSLSITYDNNGIQWDLNPEGVGVQPMFANISISFKFIGGQDISGPVARLQNAVTANYYANASVYSRHADNASYYFDAINGNDKQYL